MHYNTVVSHSVYKPTAQTFAVSSEAQARQKMTEHFTSAFNAAAASYTNVLGGPTSTDGRPKYRLIMREDVITSAKQLKSGLAKWAVQGHLNFVVQQNPSASNLPVGYKLEEQAVAGFTGLKVLKPVPASLPRSPESFDASFASCPAGTESLMNRVISETGMGSVLSQANQNTSQSECANARRLAYQKVQRSLLDFELECTSSVPAGDRFHSVPIETAFSQCFATDASPNRPQVIAKLRANCCVQKRASGAFPFGKVKLSTANQPENGGRNRSTGFPSADESTKYIDCGAKCGPDEISTKFSRGISLDAYPSPGFVFKHWTCTVDGGSPRIFHGPSIYIEPLRNGWTDNKLQHCVAEYIPVPQGHGVIRVSHGGSHVTSPFHLTNGTPTINCGVGDDGVMNDRCMATVPLGTYLGLVAVPKLDQKIEFFGDASLPMGAAERAWPTANSDSGRCLLHTNALYGRSASDPMTAWAARCSFKATQPENLVHSKSSPSRPHCTEPAPAGRPTCIR